MIRQKLNLAAFKHVEMEVKSKKDKDKKVKGVFIPYEANDIFVSEKGGKYFDLVHWPNDKLKDATHISKQSFSKEQREAMSDEDKKNQPMFGTLNTDVGGASESNNNAGSGQTFEEDDDLPF